MYHYLIFMNTLTRDSPKNMEEAQFFPKIIFPTYFSISVTAKEGRRRRRERGWVRRRAIAR